MRLTETEYTLLRELQRNERYKRDYVKITTLLMLHLGESPEKIGAYLGISTSTISRYEQLYESSGVDGCLAHRCVGYSGKLDAAQSAQLRGELTARLYPTSTAVGAYIEAAFGIRYTPQGVVALLHRLGFRYKKTKLVPCEADIAKQAQFLRDFEALRATLSADTPIYFLDAVHPQHNTRSAYGWIKRGEEREIPSVSGRRRLNLNGALNAVDVTDVVVIQSDTINADSTWALYQALEAKHPNASDIYVICDNARYYKNAALTEKLKNSRIRPLFLPPYSPNLNLIERLWKFLRKKVIDYQFYREFDVFKAAVRAFFDNIQTYKTELSTLLTLNFHTPKAQSNF